MYYYLLYFDIKTDHTLFTSAFSPCITLIYDV